MTEKKAAPKKTARKSPSQSELMVVDEIPPLQLVTQESQYLPLITQAIDKDVDIEKLERLFALQTQWEEGESKKLYLQSHSSFQTQIPLITKKGHADFGDGKAAYDYAKLEDIAEGIKPYLARNGLSYSWECVSKEGGYIEVTCTMSHISGYSKSSTMISTPDTSGGKNALHSIASARSYLKRYTLLDVAGVTVAGEDDDGHEAVALAVSPVEGEPGVEYCSDEHFSEKLPLWQGQILEGGKEPKWMIGFLATKGINLTEPQKEILINTGAGS